MEQTEIMDGVMLLDTRTAAFDMLKIENRRFMYHARTGTLILGRQYHSGAPVSSHAEEHAASGAAEPFDEFMRGWVGAGVKYARGVIRFAPAPDKTNAALFGQACSALAMFRENGANGFTVVRGFGGVWEQPLSHIFHPPRERQTRRMSEPTKER
jgi:hypothetical protein